MTLTAKISAAEVTAQVEGRFVGKYVQGLLINAPGVTYTPGITSDSNFLSNEVALGLGGYSRQSFFYNSNDVSAYADDGVGLSTKGTIFAHDGSSNAIEFTHACIIWSAGNVEGLKTFTIFPSTPNAGTYENIPTTSDNNGVGLTVDLEVTHDTQAGTYTLVWSVNNPGADYVADDTVTISPTALTVAGVIDSVSQGGAQTQVSTVSANIDAGNVIAVAKTTSPVILDGGNEAAFFWDLKAFGFNS